MASKRVWWPWKARKTKEVSWTRFYSRGTYMPARGTVVIYLSLLALQILDQGTSLLHAVRGSGMGPLPEVRPTCLGTHIFLLALSQLSG